MSKRKRETPVAAKPATHTPSHICPVCRTAVWLPDTLHVGDPLPPDTLFVNVPGYQAFHCLKCWGEMLRKTVPALVPMPAKQSFELLPPEKK